MIKRENPDGPSAVRWPKHDKITELLVHSAPKAEAVHDDSAAPCMLWSLTFVVVAFFPEAQDRIWRLPKSVEGMFNGSPNCPLAKDCWERKGHGRLPLLLEYIGYRSSCPTVAQGICFWVEEKKWFLSSALPFPKHQRPSAQWNECSSIFQDWGSRTNIFAFLVMALITSPLALFVLCGG